MGLFDFLKKKKNNEYENVNVTEDVSTDEVTKEVSDDNEVMEEDVQPVIESVEEDAFETVKAGESDNEDENVIEITETEEIPEEEEEVSEITEEVDTDISETEKDEASYREEATDDKNTALEEVNIEKEEVREKKTGFFARIKAGLSKTRDNIMSGVDNVLKSFVKIDEDLFEELEEALIMADIGVDTSLYIIEKLREKVKDEKATEASQVKGLLVQVITEILEKDDEPLELPSPSVILVIGVNGVGKTTTIGKLAHNYQSEGKSVLLAAADTFRAAAIDQLQIWGDRNNCDVIKHQENSDPAAVVFDAVNAAKARKTDILICDTAGRLHNKKNLMEELRKIAKVIEREYPEAHTEVFLVLDSTTGQNALQQAKLFKEVADITGLILTKLDGTAKGGIVLAIKHDMNIPVRYIGVGEQINDLQPFNSKDFAKALFDKE